MSTLLPVNSNNRPIIVPNADSAAASVDHGFDRDHQSLLKSNPCTGSAVVGNFGIFMKFLSHAMTNVVAHDTHTLGLSHLLNCMADVSQTSSHMHGVDAGVQALSGRLDKLLVSGYNRPTGNSNGRVCIVSFIDKAEIQRNDVSCIQNAMPRNAMDDLFVDGDTQRCRIAVVVQECRLRSEFTDPKFCRMVQFTSRHAGRNHLSYLAQHLTELGPGNTQVLNVRSGLKPDHQEIAVVDGQSLRHRFVRTHPCSDTLLAVVFPLDEGCTTEVTESLPLWLRIVHVVHTAVGRADASSRYAAERCLDRQVNIYGCGQAKVLLCQILVEKSGLSDSPRVPVQNKACLRLLGRQKRFDDNHVDILVAHKTPTIDPVSY